MGKIYILEDDKNISEIEQFALKNAGYEVSAFATASDFENALTKEHPDLIIMDIMLPDRDGLSVLKDVRAEQSTAKLPVIMVTAKTSEMDKVKGLDQGADDYMTKPVDEEEMILRIRALLRRAQIVNERRITIADVCLDYDSLTVSRGDESQTLPRKEFYLLYKLLSYPGKIFTRIQLMDEIWGMESQSDDNTINVHINRLRKRFEDYPEFSIETIRGLGYKAVKHL